MTSKHSWVFILCLLSLLMTGCDQDKAKNIAADLIATPSTRRDVAATPTPSFQARRASYFYDVGLLEMQLGAHYAAVSAFETAAELARKALELDQNDAESKKTLELANKSLEEARRAAAQATPVPATVLRPLPDQPGSSGSGSPTSVGPGTPTSIPPFGPPFSLTPPSGPTSPGGVIIGPTLGPTPTPVACLGDEKLVFDPPYASVGDQVLITVTSARQHSNVRLATQGRAEVVSAQVPTGTSSYAWQWVVTADTKGTFNYSFYSENTACASGTLTVTGRWQHLSSGLPSGRDFRITSIQVSPHYPFDQTLFLSFDGKGVFKSTNADATFPTFDEANKGLSSLGILSLAISPNYGQDGVVFAGSRDGFVFRTSNGGESWTQLLPAWGVGGAATALAISPNFTSDGTVFVGVEGFGVFVSFDSGATWKATNEGLMDLAIQSLAVSPNFTQDRTIYAATKFSGVFKVSLTRKEKTGEQRTAGDPRSSLRMMSAVSRIWWPFDHPGGHGAAAPSTPKITPLTAATAQKSTFGGRQGVSVQGSGESASYRVASGACTSSSGPEGIRIVMWAGNAADSSVFRTPSGPVKFTYQITNTGASPLYDILIRHSTGDQRSDIKVGEISLLPPLTSEVRQVTIPVRQTGTHTGTVIAYFGSNLSSSVSCSDNASVEVTPGGPQTFMRLLVWAGSAAHGSILTTRPGPVTFTYEVKNIGTQELRNIIVNDDNGTPENPADDILVGMIPKLSPLANTDGSLNDPSAATAVLTKEIVVTEDRKSTAAAIGYFGDLLTDTATVTDTAATDVVRPSINLLLTVGNAPDGRVFTTGPGPVTFTYVVTNDGDTDLNNIRIVDDNGTPGSGANAADDILVGAIPILKAGRQAAAVTATFTVARDITHRATVTADSVLGRDSASGSDDASVKVVQEAPSSEIITDTWTSLTDANLEDLWVRSLAISPLYANDRTIFAGGAFGGLFKHDGKAWKRVSSGLAARWDWVQSIVLSPRFPQEATAYVGTRSGAYRTTDGGDTWTFMSGGLPDITRFPDPNRGVRAIAISPDFANDRTVFAGVWLDNIYRARD